MINKYLKWLNEHDEVDESGFDFAIDSVHTGKLPSKKVIVGEDFNIDADRILIDFDQVIHKYSVGWLEGIIYDEPIPGAKEAIDKFRKDGYEIIIFTSRLIEEAHGEEGTKNQIKMINEWLEKHDIKVDGLTCHKLPAQIYIDDRGLRFEGVWNDEFYKKVISKIQENK